MKIFITGNVRTDLERFQLLTAVKRVSSLDSNNVVSSALDGIPELDVADDFDASVNYFRKRSKCLLMANLVLVLPGYPEEDILASDIDLIKAKGLMSQSVQSFLNIHSHASTPFVI